MPNEPARDVVADSSAATGFSYDPHAPQIEPRLVAAALAGLIATWVASEATGLLAHPLRQTLVWLAGAATLLLGWPSSKDGTARRLVVVAGVLWIALSASAHVAVDVAAVAVLLAGLALGHEGIRRAALGAVAQAAGCLAVFKFAVTAFPVVWWAADRTGAWLGDAAGALAGRALNLGATFGGVDYLVTMAALYPLWLRHTPAPRGRRAAAVAAMILAAQAVYLVALAYAADLERALPDAPPPAQRPFTANREVRPALAWWTDTARLALPWNLPLLAVVLHAGVAGAMLRWGAWRVEAGAAAVEQTGKRQPASRPPGRLRHRLGFTGREAWGCGLAALVAVTGALWPAKLSLEGKTVLVNEKGFLNWLRPEHGSYGSHSSGMYGLLADHLALYGATVRRSTEFTEAELAQAQVVMLIFPNEPWPPGQLDRLWRFVERGGSLLVLGEHTTRDPDGSNRFNEVLRPTAMQVGFDSATFAVGGWLHSYAPRLHPATLGIADHKNSFGVVIGASVEVGWPAQPVLSGRWGWNDPGDEGERGTRALMGNDRYDPGERLGDVVLAAEQRLGQGRVVVFGDTSGFVNGIAVNSHEFLARLFGYLANGRGLAQPAWRQTLGALAAAALFALLLGRAASAPRLTALTLVALSLGAIACGAWSRAAGRLLPDGRRQTPNNLAYIDSTHLGRYSEEGWRDDGVAGLQLTLMRDRYLPFSLPEFSRDRLAQAGLLVSIAPSRTFTSAERRVVREFVEGGGIFLITVGYEERRASESLLDDFGFRLAAPARVEPQPMGYFKVPFVDTGQYKCFVRYHTAWPVSCTDTNAQVIAYGHNNVPVILFRRVGQGKFVVIGDSSFALNKNLENQDGTPIEGLRENAVFWRWFLTVLRDQTMWVPPVEATVPSPRPAASGR